MPTWRDFRQPANEPHDYPEEARALLWQGALLESAYRARILAAPPWTPERDQLAVDLYSQIHALMPAFFASIGLGPEGWLLDRSVAADSIRALGNGKTCLEIGAGTGALCKALAQRGFEVTGIDCVAWQEWQAIESGTAGRARFQACALRSFECPPSSFDLCVLDNVLEHLAPGDYETAISRAFELLVPGGWAVVVMPNALTGPHDLTKYFLEPGEPAQGAHLNERTLFGLSRDLWRAGFRGFRMTASGGLEPSGKDSGWRRRHLVTALLQEASFGWLPFPRRERLLSRTRVTFALAGRKPRA
jgi:SAM-dependent methyltransferase